MKRRGIVLVLGLVITVVTFMFVGASLALGPAGTVSAQHGAEIQQAQRAAESGVQYALSQLRKNPDWRGDLNAVTVSSADLYVEEEHGNVVGLVRTPDGKWSQFRLRFNYQDGGHDQEGLPDPAMEIDHPYVSVNNLRGGAPAPVPRADGPGDSVPPGATAVFQVPARGVSLAVQGRAGVGMRLVSPTDPNLAPTSGTVARVTVEGIYQISGGAGEGDDSAAMAAAGFQVDLLGGAGAVSFTSKTGGHIPRIRSKKNVRVNGGAAENLTTPSGVVATQDSTVQAQYDSTKVSPKEEKLTDSFYQLEWKDVKRADKAGPSLAAGTYVWWEDGSLHYYDMSYSDYVNWVRDPGNANDPGSPATLPGSVKVLGSGPIKTLELESSLYVQPTAQTEDLAIITRQGAPQDLPGGGAGGPVDVVAGQIVSQGAEQQFFQNHNYASGSLTVNDAGGNLMFTGTWSSAMSPSYSFSFSGTGPYTRVDLFRFLMNPSLYPGAVAAPGSTYMNQNGEVAAIAAGMNIDPSGAPGQINPPGVSDSLTARDVALVFKGDDEPVTLSGEGNIRLEGAVQGTGGSITAEKDIRVTGLGADFSATPGSSQAVNMYAKGDVFFSTLQPDGASLGFANVHLKGIVYSWGDFVARLGNASQPGSSGVLEIDGSLIAYGGDPETEAPGENGRGKIHVVAERVDLSFDPSYLGALDSKLPASFELDPVSWSNRLP